MFRGKDFGTPSKDPDKIKYWWKEIPNANLGLPTSIRRNALIIILRFKRRNFFLKEVIIVCDLEQKIKNLPEKPGVYIMRDKTNEIIYVGKAKILKNRARQYFNNNNHQPKVAAMISNI
jgi:hypothetical protein